MMNKDFISNKLLNLTHEARNTFSDSIKEAERSLEKMPEGQKKEEFRKIMKECQLAGANHTDLLLRLKALLNAY